MNFPIPQGSFVPCQEITDLLQSGTWVKRIDESFGVPFT